LRRWVRRIRTITALTTEPFLMSESGAASFTEHTTMSPNLA